MVTKDRALVCSYGGEGSVVVEMRPLGSDRTDPNESCRRLLRMHNVYLYLPSKNRREAGILSLTLMILTRMQRCKTAKVIV